MVDSSAQLSRFSIPIFDLEHISHYLLTKRSQALQLKDDVGLRCNQVGMVAPTRRTIEQDNYHPTVQNRVLG
jgi:hypothetical protein